MRGVRSVATGGNGAEGSLRGDTARPGDSVAGVGRPLRKRLMSALDASASLSFSGGAGDDTFDF